jgi:hypothetical protein
VPTIVPLSTQQGSPRPATRQSLAFFTRKMKDSETPSIRHPEMMSPTMIAELVLIGDSG